jgi:hypothetical protein
VEKLRWHFPRPKGHQHPLIVEPTNGGFIVRVGCQTVVATDVEKLIPQIADYLRDPKSWTRGSEGLVLRDEAGSLEMPRDIRAAETPVLNEIDGRNTAF